MRHLALRVVVVLAGLSNAEMDTFTSGVATNWSSFATGFVPASLSFFPNSANFRTRVTPRVSR